MGMYNQKLVLFSPEVTPGTYVAPTRSVLCVGDIGYSLFEGPTVERNQARPVIGSDLLYHVSIYETITFDVEMAGSVGGDGVAPEYGPLLTACGMIETVNAGTNVQYTLRSDVENADSISIIFVLGNTRHHLRGCRGNVEFTLNVESIPVMRFTFMGIVHDRVQGGVTGLNFDFSTFATPKPVSFANTDVFTVHGVSTCSQGVTLNLNNDVINHHLVNCRSIEITDRAPGGQVTIEEPDLQTTNFYEIIETHTTGPFEINHDGVNLTCAQVQLVTPSTVDLNGTVGLQMNMRVILPDDPATELVLTVIGAD
jgi:hypothetical protein